MTDSVLLTVVLALVLHVAGFFIFGAVVAAFAVAMLVDWIVGDA